MATTITDLPTPPSRERPTTFSTESDEFLAALPVFVTETNTVAGEMNTIINDSETAKTGAEAAASAAEAAEAGAEQAMATAIAATDATLYSGSATYNTGDAVIEVGIVYRCLNDGVTGDNPNGSTTGNWVNPIDLTKAFTMAVFAGSF